VRGFGLRPFLLHPFVVNVKTDVIAVGDGSSSSIFTTIQQRNALLTLSLVPISSLICSPLSGDIHVFALG